MEIADDSTVEFARLLDRLRPRWFVWENVPGVLSADGGRAFGIFLGLLGQLGYGTAYRVLDAQYFGVPQRRRRVFVVGYFGDWRRAAAVLFERESLCGHPAPRRESRSGASLIAGDGAGDGVTQSLTVGLGSGGPDLAHAQAGWLVTAFSSKDDGRDATADVSPTLRSMNETAGNQNGGGQLAVAFAQDSRSEVRLVGGDGETTGAIAADVGVQQQTYVAFQSSQSGVREVEMAPTLDANNGSRRQNGIASRSSVRRLTPRECERLQGFPDDFTLVPDPRRGGKPATDQPRYHALGNSMAVPVMRWIGDRIAFVESLT